MAIKVKLPVVRTTEDAFQQETRDAFRRLQTDINALELASGPAGPTGPTGPAGADGVDGTDGTDGADGADGADGVDATPGQIWDTELFPMDISFGLAFDVWNPGTLGRTTLIHCRTDGSARTVRGLIPANDGDVVILKHVDPIGQEGTDLGMSHGAQWAHRDAASALAGGQFINGGAATANGSGQTAWYCYNTATPAWYMIART